MKFKVLSNLSHNGVNYKKEDIIDLPDEESTKLLVKDGVLGLVESSEEDKGIDEVSVETKKERKAREKAEAEAKAKI